MTAYRDSLNELIHTLGFEQVLRPPTSLLRLTWPCFAFYPAAEWRVRRWDGEPGRPVPVGADGRGGPAQPRPVAGTEPRATRSRGPPAAHRYRVYWEALRLSGLSRGRRRLIALYLDGSQHHIRQPVTLHLTTLDKGQMTQPWQGEGGLRDTGHGGLEPYVLTAARREHRGSGSSKAST